MNVETDEKMTLKRLKLNLKIKKVLYITKFTPYNEKAPKRQNSIEIIIKIQGFKVSLHKNYNKNLRFLMKFPKT